MSFVQRHLPQLTSGLIGVFFGFMMLPPHDAADDWHYHRFGQMPVLEDGRFKPMDTVARNSLMAIIDFNGPTTFFFAVLLVFLAVFLFCFRLTQSRFGSVLQGIRDNPQRAGSIGYNTYRYQLVGFIIAGALAGLGGMLHANLNEYVSPDLLNWEQSGDLLIMLILGGVGTLIGPVFGAAKWAAYRDADVFVLPSQNENFGNTAAEAVAAGTPVIVTEQCGIAPLLANEAGLVVPRLPRACSGAM